LKSPLKSKIFITNIGGSVIFLLDGINGFLSSGGLDNLCAQKSSLAGGIMIITAFMRYYFTSEPILVKKDGN
jgi:hypothetical protein